METSGISRLLMLRCDECKLLIFANSLDSEDQLIRLCNLSKFENPYLGRYDMTNL